MKRLFVNFMTCAAMATALTLAACSSDSDGEGNGNGNGGNGEGTGSSIVVGDNILSGTLTGEQTLESKEYILNGTVEAFLEKSICHYFFVTIDTTDDGTVIEG